MWDKIAENFIKEGANIIICARNPKNLSDSVEYLKSYSNHVMRKGFLSISIPKLPVCTTEQAIEIIKNNIDKLNNWKNISEVIPKKFKKSEKLKKTGLASFFSASLELTKEGILNIMQKKEFDKILIKEKK